MISESICKACGRKEDYIKNVLLDDKNTIQMYRGCKHMHYPKKCGTYNLKETRAKFYNED